MSNTTQELEQNDAIDAHGPDEEPTATADDDDAEEQHRAQWPQWTRIVAFGLSPAIALSLTLTAGYLKWEGDSAREAQLAGTESAKAASDSTVALLSYRSDTVDKELDAARDRLTGTFRDSYTQLINDVVIPGAKEKHISSVATVPAIAIVSSTEKHAVVLVFVDQTITIGSDAPTSNASSVRVTLDKVRDRWLISQFEPV
jgi:Mce-associated membrane protein